MKRMTVTAALLLFAGLLPLAGGQVLNEAQRARHDALSQPPPMASSLPPLVYSTPLPADPVAWLDGVAIPASDLLRTTLEQNLSLITQTLIDGTKLELELAHRGIELSEEDVMDELAKMIEKMAPGKTIKDLTVVGANSMKQLKRQARTNRGWKVLYWEQFKVPEDQRVADINPLVLTIIRRQIEPGFEMRVRGTEPGPPSKGDIFWVKHLASKKEASCGASEALDFLMGLVKQGSLKIALDTMIDTMLVDKAMKAAGVEVTDKEVARYSAAEDAKFAGTIIPREAILRQQGLTKDQDNERWRRVEAWKRIAAEDPALKALLPTDQNLTRFLEENRPYFMNETRRISHILVKTADDVTSLPFDDGRQAELKKRARTIYEKAAEGVDFAKLARLYSDDLMTARGDGRMSQPIKSRGGGLDPAFRNAVWELENVGDIHAPVKSVMGWHIIKLDEHKKPARAAPDFTRGTHREWLMNEYCAEQMETWLKSLRKKAEIKTVPDAELFAYKNRSYYAK